MCIEEMVSLSAAALFFLACMQFSFFLFFLFVFFYSLFLFLVGIVFLVVHLVCACCQNTVKEILQCIVLM